MTLGRSPYDINESKALEIIRFLHPLYWRRELLRHLSYRISLIPGVGCKQKELSLRLPESVAMVGGTDYIFEIIFKNGECWLVHGSQKVVGR
ncbi:hypothetical protein CEXT_764801 [Caerostris extrusa]|uniref:Uncharacterized protein n=1 Tax=Caerostris extrusa TaxID=172846 RepID=A0AAV4NW24_CAEEX|nr:hypothetical protein CEXT_764801 [Caerostris extrusa]